MTSNLTAEAARRNRAANNVRTVVRQAGKIRRRLQLFLASTAFGRIALHLLVALKAGHYLWHLQGVARELVRH